MAGRRSDYNSVFADWALKIILANPDHRLGYLVNRETGKWISRSPTTDLPAMQVGHRDSKFAGLPERLAIEDAEFNWTDGGVAETHGVALSKQTVLIDGVPVDYLTALRHEGKGGLPVGTTALAPSTEGWSPRFGIGPAEVPRFRLIEERPAPDPSDNPDGGTPPSKAGSDGTPRPDSAGSGPGAGTASGGAAAAGGLAGGGAVAGGGMLGWAIGLLGLGAATEALADDGPKGTDQSGQQSSSPPSPGGDANSSGDGRKSVDDIVTGMDRPNFTPKYANISREDGSSAKVSSPVSQPERHNQTPTNATPDNKSSSGGGSASSNSSTGDMGASSTSDSDSKSSALADHDTSQNDTQQPLDTSTVQSTSASYSPASEGSGASGGVGLNFAGITEFSNHSGPLGAGFTLIGCIGYTPGPEGGGASDGGGGVDDFSDGSSPDGKGFSDFNGDDGSFVAGDFGGSDPGGNLGSEGEIRMGEGDWGSSDYGKSGDDLSGDDGMSGLGGGDFSSMEGMGIDPGALPDLSGGAGSDSWSVPFDGSTAGLDAFIDPGLVTDTFGSDAGAFYDGGWSDGGFGDGGFGGGGFDGGGYDGGGFAGGDA
jgi:hypothetical protein